MGAARLVPVLLLAVGAILIASAVLRGGASVAVVVVVPVVFGASAEFFLGAVLLFLGLVTLPLAFGYEFVHEGGVPAEGRGTAPATEVGGLVLIGPLPIFVGRWKSVSRRSKIAAAVVGGALLALVVLGLALAVR